MGTPWWRPKNDVERAMLDTLRRGDHAGYLRLVTGTELYLPQQVDDDGETEHRLPVTSQLAGATMVLVFSSPTSMAASVTGMADCHTTTTYRTLRRQLAPQLRLAVNPGTPIATFPTLATLDRAARGRGRWRRRLRWPRRRDQPPPGGEGRLGDQDGVPTFDPVMARLLPVVDSDADPAVEALLDTMVFVPTRWQVQMPEDLLESPLHVAERDGAPAVTAFTTADGAAGAHPDLPHVRMPFLLLLSLLPDRTGLVVDPSAPGEVVLRGDRLLLTLFLAGDHRPAREIPAQPRRRPGLDASDPDPLMAHVTGFPPPGLSDPS